MLIQCIAYFIAQYVGGQAMYRTERLGVYTAATRSCKPKKIPRAPALGDFKAGYHTGDFQRKNCLLLVVAWVRQ